METKKSLLDLEESPGTTPNVRLTASQWKAVSEKVTEKTWIRPAANYTTGTRVQCSLVIYQTDDFIV